MKRYIALCLALFALGDQPTERTKERAPKIAFAPQEIPMGGSYQSCIDGLGEGMSADVRYRRPNFQDVGVQFDWQQEPCEKRSINTGWDKDVGLWEIVEIRLHKKGDYHASWQETSAKINVLPNDQLKPEFEHEAQVNRQAVKFLWMAAAGLAATILVAFLLGKHFPKAPNV